jgi:dienelactone hydrolase
VTDRRIDLTPVSYEYGGQPFTGYLADGSQGRGSVPGILVAHEGGGLTDHPRERARMLAELGYVAFAMDIFGKPDMPLEEAKALVRNLLGNLPELRGRARAALDVLRAQPHVDDGRLAAIGFCIGGTTVLELARSGADIKALVGFHAGLTTTAPEDARAIRGNVLVCLGADDPIVNAEQRAAFCAEMTAAGVDWQMHLYGGVGHSFTNPEIDAWEFPGFAYDAVADARSWEAMRDFFDEVLGQL